MPWWAAVAVGVKPLVPRGQALRVDTAVAADPLRP